MSLNRRNLTIGVLLALSYHESNAQPDVSKTLIEQAQYWQSRGDNNRASEAWNKLLVIEPKQPRALYGLAIIELDQKKEASAKQNLQKLKEIDPKSIYVLQLEQDITLRTGNNPAVLEKARLLAESGEIENAIAQYNLALENKTPQGAIALEYYGFLGYTPTGWKTSRVGLERLLKESPGNNQIELALAKLLIRNETTRIEGVQKLERLATATPNGNGDAAESWRTSLSWFGVPQPKAFPLFESYLKSHPNDAQIRAQLNSGIKQQQTANSSNGATDPRAAAANRIAKEALQRGDEAGARMALEDAMSIDRNDPWIRLELAQLYLKSGQKKAAQGIVDGLVISQPKQTEPLYASAILAYELQDWEKTQAIINQIPAKSRSREILELQKSAYIQEQAALASKLTASGQKPEALAILAKITPMAGTNLDLLGSIATAYINSGNPEKGLALLRQTIDKTSRPSNNLLLQYAGILLNTNQDVECAGVLNSLQNKKLNEAERNDYENILFVYSLRQVDALRDQGKLTEAETRLQPLIIQRPNDPAAMAAQARLYVAQGEYKKALAIYKQRLKENSSDADAQLEAAQIATQARDYDYANQAIQSAILLQPENPQVLATAARIYKSQGKIGKAAELLNQAVSLNSIGDGESIVSTNTNASNSPNEIKSSSPNPPSALIATTPILAAKASPAPTVLAVGPDFTSTTSAPASVSASAPIVVVTDPALAAKTSKSSTAQAIGPDLKSTTSGSAPLATSVASLKNAGNGKAVNVESINENSSIPSPVVRAGNNLAVTPNNTTNLLEELNQINQERSPEFLAGTQIRNRNGAAGTGKLTDIETPLEARYPIGDGKGILQITPTSLNAGTLNSDNYSRSTFGSGITTGSQSTQRANGVGFSAGYKTSGISADAGVTPVGFTFTNFTGGLKLDGALDEGNTLSYLLNVSSRPVTDSLLSFAGTRDSISGQSWGGVMASGARLGLGKYLGSYGFQGAVGYYSLNGHNVASNKVAQANVGTYVQLIQSTNYNLTSGLDLNVMSYQKNLSYYTFGQGGYFSPQQYQALSVPLSWSQRSGNFTYIVRGSLGIQHYSQDASNYFPTSSSLQASNGNPVYSASSSTGLGYNVAGGMEYQMAPKVFLGASAQSDNTATGTYRQWGAGLYLRYSIESITSPMQLPVNTFRSPYGI